MAQAKRKGQQAAKTAPRPGGQVATWLVTVGVVMAVSLTTLYLVNHQKSAPAPKAAKTQSASDRNASPALIAAANAIGFHTSTEPGVGLVEDKPASEAAGPSTGDLLKPGTTAPPFT